MTMKLWRAKCPVSRITLARGLISRKLRGSAMQQTQDIHVRNTVRLTSPRDLKARLPMSETANRTVVEGRRAIERVLAGDDKRLMVTVGPCSIHDPKAGLDYAAKLAELARRVEDRLLVVMRVYFEKPRTTVGW